MSASPTSLAFSSTSPPSAPSSPPTPSGLWDAVISLLLHRHMWVRKAAARMLGAGLASLQVCGLVSLCLILWLLLMCVCVRVLCTATCGCARRLHACWKQGC